MPSLSRRTFLRSAGAGVAAVGVASAVPMALASSAAADDGGPPEAGPAGAPLVAYVRDVRSGRISLMVGEREIHITDKALARGLARAAR